MIFAATLMGVTFLTGLICLLDLTILKPRRGLGTKEGKIVEYAKSFFPVLLAVFIIRSFVIEPFKIPSGSMMPTLISGDFIAVNKFSYGLRLPVFNKTLIKVGEPKRGDVIVFHYPKDPNIDYIKRLIGLPGDEIRYDNKQLFINEKAIHSIVRCSDIGIFRHRGTGTSQEISIVRAFYPGLLWSLCDTESIFSGCVRKQCHEYSSCGIPHLLARNGSYVRL